MAIKIKIIHIIIILGIVALILFIPQAEPPAEEISEKSTEIQLIKTSDFKEFLDLSVSPNFVDNNGAAGRNMNGFLEVSAQRVSAKMIMRGIADNNRKFIEKGVKAIEYGFAYQNEDGSFQNNFGLSVSDPDALEANTFFLQSVGHTYLLLNQSKYSEEYLPRLENLKPKIMLALEYLEPYKEILYKKAENAPNRLVFDALAFKLNGIILGDEDYQKIGDEFIRANLNTQRADGVFIEHGGHDSSYQAVNLLKLQIYWLYSDERELKDQIANSIEKGILWEKTRIKENGEVDVTGNTRTGSCQETILGECKEVSYPEVILSFLYYAKINQDEESEIIAEKIINYAVSV